MRGHRLVKMYGGGYAKLPPMYLDVPVEGGLRSRRFVDLFVNKREVGPLRIRRNSQHVDFSEKIDYRVRVYYSPTRLQRDAIREAEERLPGIISAFEADQVF